MFGDLSVVLQIGPVSRKPDQHASATDGDFGGDFDQPRPPGAGVSFAQRIALPTLIEIAAAVASGQSLPRQRARRFDIGRIGDAAAHTDEQVMRRGV